MCGRYALYGPISMRHICKLALLFIVWARVCPAQTYSSFEPPDSDAVSGIPHLSIWKVNGEVLTAPLLPDQVAYSDVKMSPDRQRIGWLALTPSKGTSYPIPTRLVIFKGDKIERVIDGEACVFGWTFRNCGAEVAYFLETLHFSTGKKAVLSDMPPEGSLPPTDYGASTGTFPPRRWSKRPSGCGRFHASKTRNRC